MNPAHVELSELHNRLSQLRDAISEEDYDLPSNAAAAVAIAPLLRAAQIVLGEAANIARRVQLPILLITLALLPGAARAECRCLKPGTTPGVYRIEIDGKLVARCKYQGGGIWQGGGTDGRQWEVHHLCNIGDYRGGLPGGWGGGMYFGPPLLAVIARGFTNLGAVTPTTIGINGRGVWMVTTPAPNPVTVTIRAE